MRAALLPVWSGHDGPGSLNIEVGAEIIPHQLHKIWGEAESLLRRTVFHQAGRISAGHRKNGVEMETPF
jgi:hypothetical protein